MGWVFVQVWILCVVAFLAGAAVTWLLFVRPLRRPPTPDAPGWTPVPAWASGARADAEPAPAGDRLPRRIPTPSPVTATDPALAALDARGRGTPPGDPRATATGALDVLGVAGPAGIEIPGQPGPADSPDAGGPTGG